MLLETATGALSLPVLLLVALLVDAAIGDPRALYRIVPHPVALIGGLTGWLDRRLNRLQRRDATRVRRGVVVALFMVLLAGGAGWLIAEIAGRWRYGWVVELVLVSLLVAQRSLFDHVRDVALALDRDGLAAGRAAVAHIVGRDPSQLDAHGVARAAIESLAENFADGVVAPVFWYLLFGLPGLLVCKTVNTMDSMIGHRTPQHAAFGRTAARLDDVLNFVPARLAGALIAVAALFTPKGRPAQAFRVMLRDGGRHRSPNAGWPEAAMAGALSIALSGPRSYGGRASDEPWLGKEFPARIGPAEIHRALYLFAVACLVDFVAVAAIAWAVLAP
jgi:adenosylcobinamide-phosphate synthase